ncbi:hypothetical protein TRFO_04279 [Tritrichomonas foetus]|uniref:Pyridoxal phosphate homeostasis protein n=1 Tax=Tritrichomonas foetus TaxID=1144522 RepID=A0A1J4KFR7_9EUKA|nr:hypothetical protein TRFO_04279 [Tritrichomonas foetus]|eukprot:OHT10263.1 hypothetical protein TRFO_04279 [Tritrichomonas foetus]
MSSEVAQNYLDISARVKELNPKATLVAVSKTKPIEMLREAFEAGCRIFGENYVDEIVEKGPLLPKARFHMIGHLQSNKVSKVCAIPNLAMIETIDTEKLADKVNNSWKGSEPLSVMVQVNTSDEPQKNGIQAGEKLFTLVQHINEKCPNLKFVGLMTIGEIGESSRDFESLINTRNQVAEHFGVEQETIKLSMGMSADYELALEMGSDYVRVGSSIFGARQYKH